MEGDELSLVVGHVYRAKRPANSWGLVNDRQIKWIGLTHVQYDGPTVNMGSRYPSIPIEKFRAWAGRDVTDVMPNGEWFRWDDYKAVMRQR